MGRPVSISISNYYILLMPAALGRLLDDHAELKFAEELTHMSQYASRQFRIINPKEPRTNFDAMGTAISRYDSDKLDNLLIDEKGQKIVAPYIKFLEWIMHYELMYDAPYFVSLDIDKEEPKDPWLDFAREYYYKRFHLKRILQRLSYVTFVTKDIPDRLKKQLSLIGNGYRRYLELVTVNGKSKVKACQDIEIGMNYPGKKPPRLREKYSAIDTYFKGMSVAMTHPMGDAKGGGNTINLDLDLKASLIEQCAHTAQNLTVFATGPELDEF